MDLSKKILQCSCSPMRKFHPHALAAAQAGKHIYHLNIGQPDLETPSAFFEAVRTFQQPVLDYAPSPGLPCLISAIQAYYMQLGAHFSAEDILITTGGSEALQIIMQCILDEGSEVIVPEPFYPNYRTMIQICGGVIRPLPTTPEAGYRYCDREFVESAINSRTRAILISNPGNPTGVVLRQDEMATLKEIAKAHHLYLICDEVYREFVYEQTQLASFAQFEDAAENVVIIDSISKRFSACGARVGALLTKNRPLLQEAMKLCQSRLSVATLDQIGAAALYSQDKAYFDQVNQIYRERRNTCYHLLQQIPGIICQKPEGAFYMMAKLPVDNAEKFQLWLLEQFHDREETVMFAPGSGFYATDGKGLQEVRIAYVLQQADLARAIELLQIAVDRYQAEALADTV